MHSFDHDGVEIAYIDVPPTTEDRGEPILLIHGFASTHAVNWVNTAWVRTLTHAGRRVIALDNRGHGKSGKPREGQGLHHRHHGGRRGGAAEASGHPAR